MGTRTIPPATMQPPRPHARRTPARQWSGCRRAAALLLLVSGLVNVAAAQPAAQFAAQPAAQPVAPPAAPAVAPPANAPRDAAHAAAAVETLGPGSRTLTVTVGGRDRTALVHVPPADVPRPATGWPVVLALHGAGMNGPMMAWFSGLSATADKRGFIVVYPDGTGRGPFLVWNAGDLFGGRVDDVAFITALLDRVADAAEIDPRRVYACGMSNGGMMCYRLAAELSDRIAAIAPVAGVNIAGAPEPDRPVPVLHFHGSADGIVPFGPEIPAARDDAAAAGERPAAESAAGAAPPRRDRGWRLPGVGESVAAWVAANGCGPTPLRDALTPPDEPLPVTRLRWTGGRAGAEVVLVRIEGGGHTWPGRKPPVGFIGRSTTAVSANDLIWEFFERHPLP